MRRDMAGTPGQSRRASAPVWLAGNGGGAAPGAGNDSSDTLTGSTPIGRKRADRLAELRRLVHF